MSKKNKSFDEAFEELTRIANELEDHKLPLEELASKVEKAAELRDYCKKRLREIESKLEQFKEGDQNH